MTRSSLPLTLAVVALALAVLLHAWMYRYETTALAGLNYLRTDRLTGRAVRCFAAPSSSDPFEAAVQEANHPGC